VVIVPSAVIDDVLYLAESKLHKEDTTRSELEQGVPLRDVFQKHGVL
jgi:regulator of RNase E activity RraA